MILREGMSVRVVLLPDGEDPDSFARSHNASELQDFIRANEQDFITFKAKLLARDARGDVIKRAAVVGEMVASIAEIPDAIQRSMFIAECARTMEVDEQLLISEVAKKRLSSASKDEDSREFIRRQEAVRRAESAALSTPATRVTAGSSIEELEKELVKYLIKYGHEGFDFRDGRSTTELNVAETIIGELQSQGLILRNPHYRALYDTYSLQYDELGKGVEVLVHNFITHPDPEICNTAVDLLTADDIYTISKLWKKHDFSTESERERLPEALPRAVILYKSKAIEQLSTELRTELEECEAHGGDAGNIIRRIDKLNQERTLIARRLSRLIL